MSGTVIPKGEIAIALAGWSNREIETTAALIAALAHPLRLAIVHLLLDGERSVNDICNALWSSQPNVSRHLSLLHDRRVVHTRKEASRIFYSVRDRRLSYLLHLDKEITSGV